MSQFLLVYSGLDLQGAWGACGKYMSFSYLISELFRHVYVSPTRIPTGMAWYGMVMGTEIHFARPQQPWKSAP